MNRSVILAVSDTHGAYNRFYNLVQSVECDTVIFCGDGIREARDIQSIFGEKRFYCVKGNCDFVFDEPRIIKPIICNKSIYITHGCEFPRINAKTHVASAAKACGCDTAFFGHTHKAECCNTDGVLTINPGSLCFGGTYALAIIENGQIECDIRSI